MTSYVDGSNDPYQTLDIQLPEKMSGPVPVLVFIHGGAWVIGDKTDEELGGVLEAALTNGYAIVRVNYRLAQNAQWPAQIYDCKAAIRLIRAMRKNIIWIRIRSPLWDALPAGI